MAQERVEFTPYNPQPLKGLTVKDFLRKLSAQIYFGLHRDGTVLLLLKLLFLWLWTKTNCSRPV